MSDEYEVAGENGHRVRVLAEDEVGAIETAVTVDPDIDQGSVIDAAGLPIGWDGGDPHDAAEEALRQGGNR